MYKTRYYLKKPNVKSNQRKGGSMALLIKVIYKDYNINYCLIIY